MSSHISPDCTSHKMPHSGTLLGEDPNDPYEITQCISRLWFSRSRRTIAHFVAAPLGARSAIEFTRERADVRSAGYRQLQMMGFLKVMVGGRGLEPRTSCL